MELSMAARCRWSPPIYSARLHKFFRHFWLNFSKGSVGQLTTFPEDLFIFPWMEISLTKRQTLWILALSHLLLSDMWQLDYYQSLPPLSAECWRAVEEREDHQRQEKFLMRSALWYPNLFFCFVLFLILLIRARPRLWKRMFFYCRWHFSKAVITQSLSFILPGAEPLVFQRKSLLQ